MASFRSVVVMPIYAEISIQLGTQATKNTTEHTNPSMVMFKLNQLMSQ